MAPIVRDREYLTSTGVGHQYIPSPCRREKLPQIERWWCGGGAQGPSEYAAHFRPTSALRPWTNIGTTMRLSPSLLRPPTLEHFSSAGYARRVRTPASSIFPGRMEPWCSETRRAFTPDNARLHSAGRVGYKDQLTIWDAEMYPRAWGFGRQDTWLCPPSIRNSLMRDEGKFLSHSQPRNVPTLVPRVPHRGMQSEFQAAYQGIPRWYQGPINIGQPSSSEVMAKIAPHESLLAPDMYTPESTMYGSHRPTTAWV